MPTLDAATKAELLELIDPFLAPQPPHGKMREDTSVLQRAFKERYQDALPSNGMEFGRDLWAVLIVCVIIYLITSVALPFVGIILGLIPAMGMSAWFYAQHARESSSRVKDWSSVYREFYLKLMDTNLPIHLAALDDRQLVHHDDRETLRLGDISRAKNVHEALRILSRGSVYPSYVMGGLEARAKYAALYDFIFQPQEEFHKRLQELSSAVK